MVAYNFSAQFVPAVESGEKLQTIRKAGKRKPPSPHNKLQLYTGMRTKSCRLIKEVICVHVSGIRIRPLWGEVVLQPHLEVLEFLVLDSHRSLLEMAKNDGFSDVNAFFKYFENQADSGEFEGHLIFWGNHP